MKAIIGVGFCLLLGYSVRSQGWGAFLWVPVGFGFALFAAAQIVLPLILGLPRAIGLVAKSQMRPAAFGALLLTPMVWFVALTVLGFVAGWFWPGAAEDLYNNRALNLSASLGILAILLSPLSKSSRADFNQNFDNVYQRFYTKAAKIENEADTWSIRDRTKQRPLNQDDPRPRSALHELKAKAEGGEARDQCNLGGRYYEGEGVAKDYIEAVTWFRKAADQNYARAEHNLGSCYDNGHGVERDYVQAEKWYRKAAEQGYAPAQYNLGLCYQEGRGVAKDDRDAVKWYGKAAAQNFAPAQFNLGFCYEKGQGVAKDEAEAVKWYHKAAEQSDPDGQYSLGLCSYNGQGVVKDYQEAVKWYRKAAEQNLVLAQCNLGCCYAKGQGVANSNSLPR